MSWMSQLYQTYEYNVAKEDPSNRPMAAVAHMYANAQIEVTLSGEGEFWWAMQVEKEDAATLIPVTESSAGRSSGIAPHPLCDMLSYLAGDFSLYCGSESDKKKAEEKFENYIENLKLWEESSYSHPKVQAIYRYLSEKRLIRDLIQAGLVELEENQTFAHKKIVGQPYEKALVRFRILNGQQDTDTTWEDHDLMQAYTAYYQTVQQGERDICYFTGKEQTVTVNHPKGIVAANYGAKLVSANDAQGFTYRGRFQNANQACTFSYEASQKIHSALTWLAKNQGAYAGVKDKRIFICWNPKGKHTPSLFDAFGLEAGEETELGAYRAKLIKTFRGYRDQFDETDSVIIMSLDAATTGRLSVTYYQELLASDFYDHITYWGETCNWFSLKFNEKKQPYYTIQTPNFRRIVECAFGCERGGENGNEKMRYIEADDRVMKEQIQRLVKCMIEKQPVPFDLVQALTVRASTPMAYSRNNRERVVSTACAIIRKYYIDRNKNEEGENSDMKLNPDNTDRSYLFGRLLAVYEKVERATYEKGEAREPNAIRLQSVYVNHPMHTSKDLEKLLEPYFRKLSPGLRKYYKDLIGKIIASFQEEDEQKLNQGLKETYLLGYYLQRAELNKKKEEQKEEIEND